VNQKEGDRGRREHGIKKEKSKLEGEGTAEEGRQNKKLTEEEKQ
jgi:hypothetical protein